MILFLIYFSNLLLSCLDPQPSLPSCVQRLQPEGAEELPVVWGWKVSLQHAQHQSDVRRAALWQWLPGGRRGMRLWRWRGSLLTAEQHSVLPFVGTHARLLCRTSHSCRNAPALAAMPTTAPWKLEPSALKASAVKTARCASHLSSSYTTNPLHFLKPSYILSLCPSSWRAQASCVAPPRGRVTFRSTAMEGQSLARLTSTWWMARHAPAGRPTATPACVWLWSSSVALSGDKVSRLSVITP